MADTLLDKKKKISADWQNALPQLTQYSHNKFYKTLGPLIIGIELIRLPHSAEYRPHFVAYPLWEKDIKTCFTCPILLKGFYNKKRLEYNIAYAKHDEHFEDVVMSVRKQALIKFEGDVSLKNLFKTFDDYADSPPLNAAPNSFLQANLQKTRMLISLYHSNEDAQLIFQSIHNKSWNTNHFNAFGTDVNTWIESLNDLISNRELFLNQITYNKQDKKIKRLQSSNII